MSARSPDHRVCDRCGYVLRPFETDCPKCAYAAAHPIARQATPSRDHPAASLDSTFTWTDLTDLVFFSRLGRLLHALLLLPAWVCVWLLAGRMLFGLLGLGGGMVLFLGGCVAAIGVGATIAPRGFREIYFALVLLGPMLLFMWLLSNF